MNIFLRIGYAIDRRKIDKAVVKFIDKTIKDCAQSTQVNRNGRLRFKSGDYHVEIIIGNPVTLCKIEQNGIQWRDFAVCNPNDVYDWRTGAIKALENMVMARRIHLSKETRAALFEAMFKKYPELRGK